MTARREDRRTAPLEAFRLAVESPKLFARTKAQRALKLKMQRVWTRRQRLAVFGGADAA